jgi:hypothetical protein
LTQGVGFLKLAMMILVMRRELVIRVLYCRVRLMMFLVSRLMTMMRLLGLH